ncbi:36753_t:CDS:2, partial [Racocetra persica]
FPENIKRFVRKKISVLTGWSKEEVTPHFTPQQLPLLHIINYYEKMINDYENQLITLCAHERKSWLITVCHNYFFTEPTNQKRYQNIHNYYLLSPYNKSYSAPHSSCPAPEDNPTQLFVNEKLRQKITQRREKIAELEKQGGQAEQVAKLLFTPLTVWCRSSTIFPEMIGFTLRIHNGKTFFKREITQDMVGYKIGEFAPTRKKGEH